MKMKRVIVFALLAVMCFAALSLMAGCGEYDDAALLAKIEELEEQLADAKGEKGDPGPQGPAGPAGPTGPQGPKGDSGLSTTAKIYKFGETATVYFNGAPVFSITYKVKASATATTSGLFTFTNIGLPNQNMEYLIAGRLQSTSSTLSTSTGNQLRNINKDSVDLTLASFGGPFMEGFDRIYFYSPPSGLTFAVFEL